MRPLVVVERPPFLCDFTCFVDSSEKNVIITVQIEEFRILHHIIQKRNMRSQLNIGRRWIDMLRSSVGMS